MARTRPRRAPAFTLVELLVVVVIVLLVSAATLPAIIPALSHRAVSEAARILQAALVQARDTAIRNNGPRGVRFLPDPTYSAPNTTILAYNRMVPIEPGPEYSNGMVTVWPLPLATAVDPTTGQTSFVSQLWTSPLAPYPSSSTVGGGGNGVYPCWNPSNALATDTNNTTAGQCLMVEQAPLQGNNASNFINAPTSWFWNIRVGDRIKFQQTGQVYTIVGPCTVNPFTGTGNPELFVNNGPPGDPNALLSRTYTGQGGTAAPSPVLSTVGVEFLFLVNGIDDDGDGYVDNGWDGVDNNQGFVYNTIIDDQGNPGGNPPIPTEWEVETFKGTMVGYGGQLPQQAAYDTTNSSPSSATFWLPQPMNYTIFRRPVPSQSARETMLPSNVVIDATSWNLTAERSRLPVDPFGKYVDILLLPSGQVVPTTQYSSPTSFTLGDSFYQFWLSERQDVHEATELWSGTKDPNGLPFLLPMPQDAYNAYTSAGNSFTSAPSIALTGERMMVTLFSRTGQISNSSIEFFNVSDVSTPFYDSQLGAREAK
jgi:type II secretory pathway pseudopilin PulG